MINTTAINTSPLNVGTVPAEISKGTFTINGLNISSDEICVIGINDNVNVDVSTYNIPQNDGRGYLSNYKRFRNISLDIYVKGATKELFLANLNLLRKNCFKKNALLEWKSDGELKQIIVNCNSIPQAFKSFNINYLKLSVSFESVGAYWSLVDKQSTSISNITSSFQEVITNKGTANSDLVAYIFFGTTNTTSLSLELGDNKITINNSFNDNDILRIDGELKRVYVNNTIVDYEGTFPILDPFTNSIDFTINGTFTGSALILNNINYV